MKDLNQIILNPIRSRIIQYLAMNQEATAGELNSFITDVPRTTLYRHLNILLENNVIMVVEENRVRGSVERTYSLNIQSYTEENTKENATRNAFGFLMKIYGDFARYFSNDDVKLGLDRVFLSNVTFLLNDMEFDEFVIDINTLFKKYLNNKPGENRKLRSISLISSPCNEERKKDNEEK